MSALVRGDIFSLSLLASIMPHPAICSRPATRESSLLSDRDDQHLVDTSMDIAGLNVPSKFHPAYESPARHSIDDAGSPSPSADRISMEEAASLAENVPGVVLQPPSEDNADTFELLTPQALRRVRHHSGDSPSGLADLLKRKKGKKKAADQPSPSPILSAPSPSPRVLLRVPPRHSELPPLASVLERLASHTSPPVIDAPPASTHETYHRTIFARAALDLDLRNPYVIDRLRRILAKVAPDVDFTDLLESPPLDLPDPNTRVLLPGLRLTSSTPSFVRSVPSQPELLDGHTLALPSRVINAMKNNWNVHIPLTALSTHSLTSLSLSAREESGQALSVKDSIISLASSRLSAKDEGSLTAQEWLHAFPHQQPDNLSGGTEATYLSGIV
ncbi:hypothetical protein PAXINDRAFT_13084 [Paxillus involutus ATCC 200175]|uniref:Unplaced genomic scaffold PAXINscaffold_23, whole genome shotgun sequence n=1 Tax=Paxillus involutus ATCC 200175 TaxID=664439 RepID=A0A0C9SX38_PAXIN|nr:hypothetical protein PAXINDRAFT_13084 [Paxillus involutus ATCC 200175]